MEVYRTDTVMEYGVNVGASNPTLSTRYPVRHPLFSHLKPGLMPSAHQVYLSLLFYRNPLCIVRGLLN